MRFDDLIKKPAKLKKPLTYTESLEVRLRTEMAVSVISAPKFTALEWAIMEGGGSLENCNSTGYIKNENI